MINFTIENFFITCDIQIRADDTCLVLMIYMCHLCIVTGGCLPQYSLHFQLS